MNLPVEEVRRNIEVYEKRANLCMKPLQEWEVM